MSKHEEVAKEILELRVTPFCSFETDSNLKQTIQSILSKHYDPEQNYECPNCHAFICNNLEELEGKELIKLNEEK